MTDTIDLYRNGDFYSSFGSDAVCLSQVIGLVRQRAKRTDGTITHHCGFMARNIEAYRELLEDAGYQVVVHEHKPAFIL